jgi:outer membrane receptor protein involved in Fe transport
MALAERRINWTGAVFRINWSNLQQLVPTTVFNYIVNAGSARSDGFETELDAPLYQGLRIEAGASLANAHLIGAQPVSSSPGTQLHEGESLAGAPRWTVNAGLTYARPITPTLRGSARLDYTYHSSSSDLVAAQNPAYFVIPGSNLAALHLEADYHDTWSVQLGVDNLFNSFVPLTGKALDANQVQSITAARPRTFSLTFTERF